MIPNIPLLSRTAFRSGLTESTYDPRLFLMKVNHADAPVDLIFQVTLEYNASLVHEWAHWLQHHATSCGAFLNAVRVSQQMTTMRWFRDLPNAKVRILLERRDKSGSAILKLDQKTQRPIFEPEDGDDFNIYRQIWYDHQWVHAAFEDDAAHGPLGTPSPRIFGEIFADVMLGLCGEAGFDVLATDEIHSHRAREWYAFRDDLRFPSISGYPVTSRSIMEAAATVAEMELLPGTIWEEVLGDEAHAFWRDRIRRLLEGGYGAPVKAFCHILGSSFDNLAMMLPTLSAVCFAALNPPIPPFVMEPPRGRRSYAWSDIYPPLRFARLASAVRRVGLLRRWAPRNHLAQYLAKICEVAQLSSPLELTFPKRVGDDRVINFDDPTIEYSSLSRGTCYDYSFWVQGKLAEERLVNLPIVVSIGQCLSGEYAGQYAPVLTSEDAQRVSYLQCPLHWTSNDKLGFRCRPDFGNWLLRSAVMHDALFETIVGVGEYDFSRTPNDVSSDRFLRDAVHRSIEHNLLNVKNL